MNKSHLKLIVIGLMVLGLMASCKKNNGGTADGQGFKAITEQGGNSSKTHGVIHDAGTDHGTLEVQWTTYDQIRVANKGGASGCDILTYELTEGENRTDGLFYTGEDHDNFFEPAYVAAYPAARVTGISGTKVTFDLLPSQQYKENSFGEGAAPMVAYSSNQTLYFKNIVGGLCIQLSDLAKGQTVTKLELVSLAEEALWGTCEATISVDDHGVVSIADDDIVITNSPTGGNILTLDCGGGVSVTESTRFFIMVPPGKLESGFTLRVYNGLTQIYEGTKEPSGSELNDLIKRNKVVTLNNVEIVGPTLTVTTNSPSRINYNYARGNGQVNVAPASCGFVYALKSTITTPNDELILNSSNSNVQTAISSAPGTTYYAELTGLVDDELYWVRAWAKNATGAVNYGSPVELETRKNYSKAPNYGMLDGVFSAYRPSTDSPYKVRLSMGNLQYNNGTGKWRYATQQYDYVGTQSYGNVYLADGTKCDNKSVVNADGSYNASYKGWIDLFAWGTSGYNHGATVYQPWVRFNSSISANNYTLDMFRAYGVQGNHFASGDGRADWGYNPIINGRNTEGTTYKCTPNNHNFHSLLQWRENGSTINGTTNARFAFAKLRVTDTTNRVVTIQGIMLFPDVITWPTGVPYPTHINDTPEGDITDAQGHTTHYGPGYYGPLDGGWNPSTPYTEYTEAQWIKLEKAGVVFLPSAGCWGNGSMSWQDNRGGRYWSSMNQHETNSDRKYQIGISPAHGVGDGGPACAGNHTGGYYGFSVRLWMPNP